MKYLNEQYSIDYEYRKGTSDRSILLLHGLQSNRRLFASMFEDRRFVAFNLVSVDLLGFGTSDRPEQFTYDLSDQAEVLVGFLYEIDVGPVIAIGHSLGGMIATLLLGIEPGLISALVSLEGNLIGEDCGQSREIAQINCEEFLSGYSQFCEKISQKSEPSASLRAQWMRSTAPQAFYRTSKSIVEWSDSGKLAEVFEEPFYPKLMIKGAKSKFASQPHGPCRVTNVVADAGLFMLVDQPEATFELIDTFLKAECRPPQTDRYFSTRIMKSEALPTAIFVERLKRDLSETRVIDEPGITVDPRYFKAKVTGASSEVLLRTRVLQRIRSAAKLIAPEYGFIIYDGYRNSKTQAGLFDSFFKQIQAKNSAWTSDQLNIETRKFVAHPDEPSRFKVPPHESGGAVDIGLTRFGVEVDMGTEFDDLTELAATDFFERLCDPRYGISRDRWQLIRNNRRLLTGSLRAVGFTNWPHEWWHFDLGNCVWAQVTGKDWVYSRLHDTS